MKYISICKSPACLGFLIPETGNFIYHLQTGSNIPLFVSDARTGFVTVNMVVFLAAQLGFNLYLQTKFIVGSFFSRFGLRPFASVGSALVPSRRLASREHCGSVLSFLCFPLVSADTVQQRSTSPLALSFESSLFS